MIQEPSGLPDDRSGEVQGDEFSSDEENAMSEPNVSAAGDGVSDEEMVQTVAEQTDSASENADTAGKDWDGDPSAAPDQKS